MGGRVTRKEIEATFARLMDLVGGDYNHDDPYSGWDAFTDDHHRACHAVVGRYCLDFAAPYGGWCVQRMSNEAGGCPSITMHGLSAGRMTGARFVESMRFASDLIESVKS